jgi:hypothetical protein
MATRARRETQATRETAARPVALRLAAAAQAVEAVAVAAGAVVAAVITADGRNFQLGSEIGLTLVAFLTAGGLVAFAVGLNRARPWSRTPVAVTQLFVGGYAWYLIGRHLYGWGVPALLLAVACLAGLFTPASLQALNRPSPKIPKTPPPPTGTQPTKTPQATKTQQAAKTKPARKATR